MRGKEGERKERRRERGGRIKIVGRDKQKENIRLEEISTSEVDQFQVAFLNTQFFFIWKPFKKIR